MRPCLLRQAPQACQMGGFVMEGLQIKVSEIQYQELIIESNVELPPEVGYWKNQAMRMKVGDSVFFKQEAPAMSLRYALIHIGAKVSKRYMRNEKGWRVWRLEE